MTSGIGRVSSVSSRLLVAVAVACACGGTNLQSTNPAHFLDDCAATCPGGLQCICGSCTTACVVPADCGSLGPFATCVHRDDSHPACRGAGPARTCDMGCTSNADCEGLAFARSCRSGFCRPDAGPSSEPSESGGATGTGGRRGDGGRPSSAGTSGAGATTGSGCSPVDLTCYSASTGKNAPGAECMARIANTPNHIQLRQTWIDVIAPPGNTIPIVLRMLNVYTQLEEKACNTPDGTTGYMQAVDLDLDSGVSTIGYVKYTDAATAVADGLCFVDIGAGVDASNPDSGWHDIADYGLEKDYDFALPSDQMSSTEGWPEGLPPPMPQPWKVTPTKAKRLDTDFNVTTDRAQILRLLAADGEWGRQGFTGVFYYDQAHGTSHDYYPLSYDVLYEATGKPGVSPATLVVIPVRETELKYQVNDPTAPNCVGRYLPGNLDPSTACVDPGLAGTTGDRKNAWGGIFDTRKGESDAVASGYSLITELEQIYWGPVQMTLCASYPTLSNLIADGWATMTEKRCRKSSRWDPKKPNSEGLPNGDWCAATNSPATATCHDAYQSKSFRAFQAFKVRKDHCKPF
jgi:hypothetical protein